MPDLIQPFRRDLRRLVARGDTLLVAVSGGVDSLALLDLAHRAAPAFGIGLVVAHLDHGWRDGSADDAAFVAAEAERRGLTAICARIDQPVRTEAAGRAARLAFFARTAHEHGARGVLVGHTTDDQAETVLLHLVRGSGLEGLAGMRPSSSVPTPDGPILLLRPLLEFRRAQLRAYCERRGLTPREDPTNQDGRFRRNRVRHEVLPLLEDIAPGATAALARVAEIAAAGSELIREYAVGAWSGIGLAEPVAVDRVAFRRQAVGLQRALLRHAAEILGVVDLGLERIEAAREHIVRGRGGAVLEWPGSIRIVLTRGRASFVREGIARPEHESDR